MPPCKLPKDPEVYWQMLENVALGLPRVRIAEALQVPETTFSSWFKRKDVRRDYALVLLKKLEKPIQDTAERFPLQYIERHPETRETFAPPTQKVQSSSTHEVLVKLEFAAGAGSPGKIAKGDREQPLELVCEVEDDG